MKLTLALLSTATLMVLPCLGWNNPGHMAVAGIAFDELTSAQQGRLAALLRKHPLIAFITEGFPDGDISDRDLVMAAATWPDLARQHVKTTKKPDEEIDDSGGYEETAPAVDQVTFDKKLHRGWHFIDTPVWVGSGPVPSDLPAAPNANAVNVTGVLIQQLKQAGRKESDIAYDLGWLLHLVGDLHQPLHSTNGISETFHDGDHGGNFVEIDGETGGQKELHAFWDNILGNSARRDSKHRLRLDKDVVTAEGIVASVSTLHLGSGKDDVDPSHWASESLKLAEQDAYDLQLVPTDKERTRDHKMVEVLDATISSKYATHAKSIAKKRVRLAGHRLALLLKQILN